MVSAQRHFSSAATAATIFPAISALEERWMVAHMTGTNEHKSHLVKDILRDMGIVRGPSGLFVASTVYYHNT